MKVDSENALDHALESQGNRQERIKQEEEEYKGQPKIVGEQEERKEPRIVEEERVPRIEEIKIQPEAAD